MPSTDSTAARIALWLGAAVALASLPSAPTSAQEAAAGGDAQSTATAGLPSPASLGAITRLTPPGLVAHRPRFSADGAELTFTVREDGPEGAGDIYVIGADGSGLERLTATPHDERDPSFARDGRVLYASNVDGDYDIYALRRGEPEATQLTDEPGDELEPADAPVAFTLYSVGDDGCSDYVDQPLETYDKLLYTRRFSDDAGEHREIWFLGHGDGLMGEHRGRISPEGRRCDQPVWAGNGLGVAFRCGDGDAADLMRSDADFEMSFGAALQTLAASEEVAGCEADWGDVAWLDDECLSALPRSYATYPAQSLEAPPGLAAPGYSANQIVLLASPSPGGGGALQARPRHAGAWQRFELADARPTRSVWSPDGTRLAFESSHEGEPAIYLVETDFYLQDVVNLVDFAELVDQPSTRLHDHRFVARPGDDKEMFHLYDRVAYADRPVFITADAALQAFHDEFTTLLRHAEEEAEQQLTDLSRALYEHYAARAAASGRDWDRFLATYFAVPHAVLQTGRQWSTEPEGYDDWECRVMQREQDYLPEEDRAYYDEVCRPVLDPPSVETLMARDLPGASEMVEAALRPRVDDFIGRIVAHDELVDVAMPNGVEIPVDFTQFIVRGDYADVERADYFLAVMWYGQVPLPFDQPIVDLVDQLDDLTAWSTSDGQAVTALEAWRRIDGLIGSFIGQPVQATVSHVLALRAEAPELVTPFDLVGSLEWLDARLGELQVRGLEGALERGAPQVRFALLPRRLGLDTTFFSQLTHPTIELRGLPSALDVWASLGVERAHELALANEAGESWAEAYRAALDDIVAERGGGASLAATDLYASWLAALIALGQSQAGLDGELLPFTSSEAWADRLLYSTLAGYAQLKHASVLYGMEDYGVQCGGDYRVYGYVEQPVIPPPRGFVDPVPGFFHALVTLADQVYAALNAGEEPQAWTYADDDGAVLSVRDLSAELARLADAEVRGEPLTDEDYAWMQGVGTLLEILYLGGEVDTGGAGPPPGGRSERGVAMTVGIYTNVMRGQVLHLGVGRLLDLFVAVPNDVGQRITQGGLLSFYEFWHPMTDRLTDDAWNAMLERGEVPALPDWASSFIQRPSGQRPSR